MAFTDDPPWELEPGGLPWQRDVGDRRARAAALVPEMARAPLAPHPRAVEVAARFARELVPWAVLERRRAVDGSSHLARRLRQACERLGPSYVKFGQLVSMGDGIFPAELVEEFRRCRDMVPPERFALVERVLEEDLGRPVGELFAWFDPEPEASASIAQVHRARLAGGPEVAVKVQRPGIAATIRRDISVLAWVASVARRAGSFATLANPSGFVELLAGTVVEELDFRLEAQNMLDVAEVLGRSGEHAVVVPRPHPELVTGRVLVMERLEGFSLHDGDAMARAGVDTARVMRALATSFFEGAMVHGVFHGDIHGGNLLVLRDGRLALLDFGITGRLSERSRAALLRVLMAAATNDTGSQLAGLRDLGAFPSDVDVVALQSSLRADRTPLHSMRFSAGDMTDEVHALLRELVRHGARLPKELILFFKTLVYLNGATAALAPDLDVMAEMAHLYDHLIGAHGDRFALDLGVDPKGLRPDFETIRAQMGGGEDDGPLTYRSLHERRSRGRGGHAVARRAEPR